MAFGIVACSAIIDFNPVQEFIADRPFLAVILVQGAPYFLATYHAEI